MRREVQSGNCRGGGGGGCRGGEGYGGPVVVVIEDWWWSKGFKRRGMVGSFEEFNGLCGVNWVCRKF